MYLYFLSFPVFPIYRKLFPILFLGGPSSLFPVLKAVSPPRLPGLSSFLPSHQLDVIPGPRESQYSDVVMMEQSLFGQTVLTPNSVASTYASPAPGHQHLQGAGTGLKREFPTTPHGDDDDRYSHRRHPLDVARAQQTLNAGPGPLRDGSTVSPSETSAKKQKRNKPTLSCFECVERKTKVASPLQLQLTGASAPTSSSGLPPLPKKGWLL